MRQLNRNILVFLILALSQALASCTGEGLGRTPSPTPDNTPYPIASLPSNTPTAFSILTPTATLLPSTPTAAQSQFDGPSGRIQTWVAGIGEGLEEINWDGGPSLRQIELDSTGRAGLISAWGLTFAPLQARVVLVTRPPQLELVLIDPTAGNSRIASLTTVPEWLLNASSMGQGIRWYWGPQDKTVILSTLDGSVALVVDWDTAQVFYADNGCDAGFLGEPISAWGFLCATENRESFSVTEAGVLPASGAILGGSEPRGFGSVSPLADRMVYVSGTDDEFALAPTKRSSIHIPVRPAKDAWVVAEDIKWSADGDTVAVYGYSTNPSSVCPPYLDEITLGREERPCWHVFDSRSATLLWAPDEVLIEAIGSTWDRTYGTDSSIVVSPDGRFLGIGLRDGGLRYFVIVNAQSREVVATWDFLPVSAIWLN